MTGIENAIAPEVCVVCGRDMVYIKHWGWLCRVCDDDAS